MKRFKSKKGIALLVTLVVVGASAFGAYAYFTSTGSGNGTPVTVGSATGLSVVLDSTEVANAPTANTPGDTTYACNDVAFTDCLALQPAPLNDKNASLGKVPFTVTNNGENNVELSSFTITIETNALTAWSAQANTSLPACTANDFSINGNAAGTPFSSVAGGTGFGYPSAMAIAGIPLATGVEELAPLSDTPGNTYVGSFKVELVDNGLNQDNCEGVTPNVVISTTSQ